MISWIFDFGFREEPDSRAPGWTPQFTTFGLLMAALVMSNMAKVKFSTALWIVGVFDLIALVHFLRQSFSNLRRMGLGGFTRPRWWIEVAALDFTLCVSCVVFMITRVLKGELTAFEHQLVDFAIEGAKVLGLAFLVLAATSFLLGCFYGKPVRGRTLELVSFAFWLQVTIFVGLFSIDVPVVGVFVGPILSALGSLAAGVAAVWAMFQQVRNWFARVGLGKA